MKKIVSIILTVILIALAFSYVKMNIASAALSGLHVQRNNLLDVNNNKVHLYGVNRSGTEYACIQGWGIFDGPSDNASVQAIKIWNVNAVRVPLNEDCWLGINGVSPLYSGVNYQNAISNYVNILNANGMYAILELHWAAPGTQQATGQIAMPDRDHSPAFWTSVANTYKNNTNVLFDLYNEPFPDNNQDTTAAWICWKNGGTCPGLAYQTSGMQELVTTIRGTGSVNVIMAGGVQYANSLSQWLTYKPSDVTGNLAASWHSYAGQQCSAMSCWNQYIAPVAASSPLITGEIGENDCAHGFIDTLMPWLEQHNASYLAWAWNPYSCSNFPALITDYNGTPTNYGIGFKNHLASLGASPTSTPVATGTSTSVAVATSTSVATSTLVPSSTNTPVPTNTRTVAPTNTPVATVPQPTALPCVTFTLASHTYKQCLVK